MATEEPSPKRPKPASELLERARDLCAEALAKKDKGCESCDGTDGDCFCVTCDKGYLFCDSCFGMQCGFPDELHELELTPIICEGCADKIAYMSGADALEAYGFCKTCERIDEEDHSGCEDDALVEELENPDPGVCADCKSTKDVGEAHLSEALSERLPKGVWMCEECLHDRWTYDYDCLRLPSEMES